MRRRLSVRAGAWLAVLGVVALGAGSAALGCTRSGASQQRTKELEAELAKGDVMKLTSSAFEAGAAIPKKHTCEGGDVAPALAWSDVPAAAKSLVLIVDDPDAPDPAAPKVIWVHWVLFDIPPSATGLPEGGKPLPPGTREGVNDWKRTGYGGPCPPIGRHRYFHKLYALDQTLPELREPTKAELERAMRGHVIGHAELIGTYAKAG